MKKTITLFVFASLFVSAAPKPKGGPTFSLDSCTPSDTAGACASVGAYSFSGQGYSATTGYLIYASSDNGNSFEIIPSVDADGNLSAEGFGVAGAGTWTFTVYSLKHNGSPGKDLASDGALFE